MLRSLTVLIAVALLTACSGAPQTPQEVLSNSRVTFPPPDPAESGPIIFEFYDNGTALLAFDEAVHKGQTAMEWRIIGNQLCVKPVEQDREECRTFVLNGDTIIVGSRGDMNGTIERL